MGISVKRVPGPGQKNLDILIKGMGNVQGQVGWFPSARYEDGTQVAAVAYVQEKGSVKQNIPPRPFMSTTIAERKNIWIKQIAAGSKLVAQGKLAVRAVMEGVVQMAEGDVKKKIASITSPKLSILTLLVRKWRTMNDKNGQPNKVSGRTLGMLMDMYDKGEISPSGVPTKPLIDKGIMLQTLTSKVIRR